MNSNEVTTSFVVENNEIERYSLNLVRYFLDKEDFAFINFQEKILENFNHDYYNIIWIYSAPLINNVNIDTLLDKLMLIKKYLRKKFYLFNQRILIIATNCTLDLTKIVFPKSIDVINGSEKEQLLKNETIKTIYPELVNYSLDRDFARIAFDINEFNLKYFQKIGKIFNKKHFLATIILASALFSFYFNYVIDNIYNGLIDITPFFVLSNENIALNRFYVFLTNSFVEKNLFWLLINVLFIFSLGFRLEKIYGTIRYFLILLISIIFINAFHFAFNYHNYMTGFAPVLFTFGGMFTYVVIIYRRFLAHMINSIIFFIILLAPLIIFIGSFTTFITLVSAFISGFTGAFIFNIPKTKYGKISHRILSFVFIIILISLLISLGIK